MAKLRARLVEKDIIKKFFPLRHWSKEHVAALSAFSPDHLKRLTSLTPQHLDVISSLSPHQMHMLGSFSHAYLSQISKLSPEDFNSHMNVLQNLSVDEVASLGGVSPRFRKPFIKGLPQMVAWDLARWNDQEKPKMASGSIQVQYGLEKGGGPEVPSTGGDSSDLIPLDKRNIFFTLLDFSGKGASANEPRGMFQGFLRGHVSAARSALRTLRKNISKVMRLNHAVSTQYLDNVLRAICNSAERTHNQHFPEVYAQGLTGYFQLRPEEKKVNFRYVHMGSEPIYVLRKQDDGTYRLERHGHTNGEDGPIALGRWFGGVGQMNDKQGNAPSNFKLVHELDLNVGDKLVGYTDGLSDARNKDGDFFGHDRIEHLLKRNAHLSAQELTALLKKHREKFLDIHKYPPDDLRIRVFVVLGK
ncbi:SpoIIE family protein phosphatase [Candidatus Micrarchaeota archaeon]|nr:SpoIIE family protein phosphatase [Candidatus Micrarchaeota archaeon]